jgi:tripartite-type tricarboxylate transporter receptor subunit TctC
VVGFAPGGTADTIARRVGDKLGGRYARVAVVDNRTGAGGQIAVQAVKGMPGDGSAILVTPASMLMIYPHIYKKLAYDPIADLTPLSLACTFEFGLAVGPAVPASVANVAEFLAWVKANPAKGSYGSPAPGSVPHFLGELLSRAGAVAMQHIPYRGSQPAVLDLIGGQIAAVSAPMGEFLQHLPGGKVRLLATSGAARSRFAPSVATYAEQGFAELQVSEWFGFFGPARMSGDTVARLNASLRDALSSKDVIDGLAAMGLEVAGSKPQELEARLKQDHDRWGPIVKRIGFTAES